MWAASHSVASHLAFSPAKYDARIRSLIPLYDELIAEVAGALGHAARPVRTIVDLGIGTGALARACLESAPRARVWGLEADADLVGVRRAPLGRLPARRAPGATAIGRAVHHRGRAGSLGASPPGSRGSRSRLAAARAGGAFTSRGPT